MARSSLTIPDAPALTDASPATRKALALALGEHRMVDEMKRDAKALGAALKRDRQSAAALFIQTAPFAHALAMLGPIQKFTNKALRALAYTRKSQLEMIAYALRIADQTFDAKLAALAMAVGDGEIRGQLAEGLRGGQIGLAPGAKAGVAALLDSSTNVFAVRAAFDALYDLGAKQAEARWASVLRARKPASHLDLVFEQIEEHEVTLEWAASYFPLTVVADEHIARGARRLVTRTGATFRAYLAWVITLKDRDALASGISMITGGLYWASLHDRTLTTTVGLEMAQLRERAVARKLVKQVTELDRALAKLGILTPRPATQRTTSRAGITLGKRLARVGTEGGPPLLIPAELAARWEGARGPEPFDTGKSDYERACKTRPPALLKIGSGHGLVLADTTCSVHLDPQGLLLHASGDPAEAAPERWKKLGALTVGAAGLLLLDATLTGTQKSKDRAKVPLAAGRYTVLAHRPGGFGTDFSAVRLVRA